MKAPKLGELSVDVKSTKRIRKKMAGTKKVKITINVDHDSLKKIRSRSSKTGVPYQRLLNQLLRQALLEDKNTHSRLERLEKELTKLKRKLAA